MLLAVLKIYLQAKKAIYQILQMQLLEFAGLLIMPLLLITPPTLIIAAVLTKHPTIFYR